MNLADLTQGRIEGTSARFTLINYLPTYASIISLLILVWARTDDGGVRWAAAWQTAGNLTAGELVLIAIATTLGAVVLQPLQLATVRLLEGYWPAWFGPMTRLGLRRQDRARRVLIEQERCFLEGTGEPTEAQIQAAGSLGAQLRRRFPAAAGLRATRLGNALAAAEERAGSQYGWDAVAAWPRLYPLLGDRVKALVDDRRDALDLAARLSVTTAVTGLAAIAILARSGPWLLLGLVPWVVTLIAYNGAVQAGLAYGEGLLVAFDLHRFDLIRAAHLELPDTPEAERELASELSLQWRQNVPSDRPYQHDGRSD